MEHLIKAIDVKSVYLGGASLPALFIPNSTMQLLGGVAVLTTIIYNSIRIYKELKQSKN